MVEPRTVQVVLAICLHMGFLAICLWDLYWWANGLEQYTVSRIVQDWSRTLLVLPFFLGFLAGHIYG